MSTIDRLIEQMRERGAERLVLVSGKPPVLTVRGQSEPAGEVIDRAALEGIILAMGGDATPGQRRFDHAAPVGSVEVTARITERVVQIIVRPAEELVTGRAPEADGRLEREATSEREATAEREATVDREATPEREAMSDPVATRVAPTGPPGGTTPDRERSGADQADAPEAPVEDVDPALAWLDATPRLGDPTGRHGVEPHGTGGEGSESTGSRPSRPVDAAPRRALEAREDAPAMERLFLKMVENGCSDLHISAGAAPLFRKDGRITDLGGEPTLSPRDTEALLMGITPERYRKHFETRNDTDFAYEIPGVARFRCNLFRDRKGIGGVFRQIPTDIMSAADLGLQTRLLELCQLKKGLVLVTGPTGSGKSTTLAALIDHINRTRHDHIITIEDPIEFVHENRSCLINQREVGEHTESFKVALRAALREDPDIVLVGELRDLETVEIALETAETGHLVFGTLHTNTAAGTVSRLIDQFPAGQQAQIRTMLADTLKAVIAQTLCRKIEGGRVAALEILVVNNAIANLIREDKTYQISSSMQTGKAQGMNTLNDALLELVRSSVVEPQEAYWHAVDKTEFATLLGRSGIELEGVRQAS